VNDFGGGMLAFERLDTVLDLLACGFFLFGVGVLGFAIGRISK
jgi:hypothetical protein